MSFLDFNISCKGDRCTSLLTASSEVKKGYCLLCQNEKSEIVEIQNVITLEEDEHKISKWTN